jgi:hypothetical protein
MPVELDSLGGVQLIDVEERMLRALPPDGRR